MRISDRHDELPVRAKMHRMEEIMRNKKRMTSFFIIGLAAVCMLNGCKKNEKETETQPVSKQTETAPPETEAAKYTYTSESSTFSLDLPSMTWRITKEGIDNKWVFEDPAVGKINIVHKKSKLKAKNLPQSQEDALKLLNKEKQNAFENVEFKKETISNAELYYYAGQTSDSELGYCYLIRYLINAEKEGYTVTAKLAVSDAESVQKVRNAVTSFRILREDSGKADGAGNGDDEKEDGNGSSAEGEGGNSSGTDTTEEEYRYFFDDNGNTVYAYPSSDGEWWDKDGNVSFFFMEDGVKGSDGVYYYYDPPQGTVSDGSAGESAGENVSGGDVIDFYVNGTYVTAVPNADGTWAGSDGKTYTLSDEGVTDSDGNFSKW